MNCLLDIVRCIYGFDTLPYEASKGNLKKVVEIYSRDEFMYEDELFLALIRACENGHLNVVKFLVEKGVHVYESKIETRKPSISVAAANGHLDIFKFLIANGANVHINDNQPFRWAAANAQNEMVKYILNNFDVDVNDEKGFAEQNMQESTMQIIYDHMKKKRDCYSSMRDTSCIVCMENCRDIVLNCNHLCMCSKCANKVVTCPICRANIDSRRKIFFA